MFNNKQHK